MRLLLSVAVLGMVGPVVAATLPDPSADASRDGVVVLLDSAGQVTIMPSSQWNPDGFSSCSGDAPFENSCTLIDYGWGWIVGWDVSGNWQGTPVGSVVMSTHLLMTASGGGVVEFECDWGVNPAGTILPGLIRCALLQYSENVWGTLTVHYHTGALDPHVLSPKVPSTNDVEDGVGNWQGVLEGF